VRNLELGESGDVSVTAQYKNSAGRRGLTLHQANDPQRLRGFLQRVAEAHGSASAKKAKSVLHGSSATPSTTACCLPMRRARPRTVTSTAAKSKERDHTRAMTRSERDHEATSSLRRRSATPSGCGIRATARERFAPLWTCAA
jgi:hypothetical protein